MQNTVYDPIEIIVDQAHQIFNKILLFQAISMAEEDIRDLLQNNDISDSTTQNIYLNLVEEYDRQTSGLPT